MPKLKTVWVWGAPHAEGDEDAKTYELASRPFCESLSADIRQRDLPARRKELRIFLFGADADCSTTIINLTDSDEGPLVGHIHLKESFASLPGDQRMGIMKRDFQSLLEPLAAAQGWPANLVGTLVDEAAARGPVFRWESEWKTSRSRRFRARILGDIGPDGVGRASILVVDQGGTERLRTEPTTVQSTVEALRRITKTLRWLPGDELYCEGFSAGAHNGRVHGTDPSQQEDLPFLGIHPSARERRVIDRPEKLFRILPDPETETLTVECQICHARSNAYKVPTAGVRWLRHHVVDLHPEVGWK